MVGVPRSKGCRLCVQRRVKCDQTRPTCNNCKKGNRPCPGYGQDLKFHDEGARLRRRYEHGDPSGSGGGLMDIVMSTDSPSVMLSSVRTSANTPYSSTHTEDNKVEDENTLTSSAGKGHWDVVGLDIEHTKRRTFLGLLEGKSDAYSQLKDTLPSASNLDYAIHVGDPRFENTADRFIFTNFERTSNPFYEHVHSPDMVQKQLVTNFKQTLFPDNGTIPEAFKNHQRWLQHLPPLTGTNPLLDASVRAVTLVHIGRLNNSEPFVMESRPYYGQALRLLNKTLQDKKMGMSNETLCAVILLSFYEMFASDNNESWVRHAGGVSALMRARGPARHRHGFDREIFLAYRYTLIIEAFQEDVPCFLAEPAWIQLSRDIHTDLITAGVMASRIDIFNLSEEFYACMVGLPEICGHAQALWKAKQNNTPPPYNRAQVIEKMVQSRANFKTTFTKFEAALKKAGHAPTINLNQRDPLIGIEYEFINTFVSATYTGYWTVLIVLDLCLQGMQHSDQDLVDLYKTEGRDCGLNICRSSAFMLRSSFLGPFFLIFGLRVALLIYEDSDGPEADWILRKLFEIGDRHMGIAKHVPGYRAGITVDELIAEFRARARKAKRTQNDEDISEHMEFVRQTTHGAIFDQTNGDSDGDGTRDETGGTNSYQTPKSGRLGGTLSGDWQGLTEVEDVLRVWDEQDNFQLQTNLNNLNVQSTSTGPSRGTSPMPPLTLTSQEQQFSQAAASFVMPDMNFFDQEFGDMTHLEGNGYSTMSMPMPMPMPMATPMPPSTQTPMPMPMHDIQSSHSSPPRFEQQQQHSPSVDMQHHEPQRPTVKRKNTLPRGLERFFTE